jgi:ABC-type bacteriocin/lantibiotic exporter with double-glycine peptidase domain
LIELKQPRERDVLPDQKYVYQTYNNCGPATMSMLLDFYKINISQQEIADQIRPYNNPKGYNDDKSVTLDEMAQYAVSKGLTTFKRPNGDIEKLKLFIANGIPVITISWIDEKGGFGHYRIVKGYSELNKQIIEDDSIFGQDQPVSYDDFMRLWQVFNYDYLIVVPPDKISTVNAILKDELSEKTAYTNALKRATNETGNYAIFNQSVSEFYLGNYQKSVSLYEQVAKNLPYRLLWYQIEPVEAYYRTHNFEKVFSLSDQIFKSGNPSASELYQLRGESLLEQGKKDQARLEFEKAQLYNKNYLPATNALSKL